MIHVGTAGWSISSKYKEAFAGDGSHLQRYARRFDVVEINTSFYRHHQPETYARWAASVPAGFRFSLKTPNTMTHEGELIAHREVLARFAEEVSQLGDKLAVVLVQLPPKLEFDAADAKRFFKAFQKRIHAPLVCEPRHPTWASVEARALLTDCHVARVAADPPPWEGADLPDGWKDLAYFRWHGKPRKYYSDYDRESLAALRTQLAEADQRASNVWMIFDNTALGHALGNALTMQEDIAGGNENEILQHARPAHGRTARRGKRGGDNHAGGVASRKGVSRSPRPTHRGPH
jgi:uncharacterized protein YecE (DUF72 family)